MIDDVTLRNQVRTTLATRPPEETFPEPLLLSLLSTFFGTRIAADQMMRALQWNQARGWVEFRRNTDLERDEWRLSERGRIKEGL